MDWRISAEVALQHRPDSEVLSALGAGLGDDAGVTAQGGRPLTVDFWLSSAPDVATAAAIGLDRLALALEGADLAVASTVVAFSAVHQPPADLSSSST